MNFLMSKVYGDFFQQRLPRVLPQMRETLQFSPEKIIRDWCLSEHITMIRLYGFVHQTFILLTFLTVRVFDLEMIRQRFIVENDHFNNFRKSSDIKFPWAIGPFVIKNKAALPLIESLLREMGFPIEASINYDPHHIISIKRKANKNNPFEHHEVACLLEATNWSNYP